LVELTEQAITNFVKGVDNSDNVMLDSAMTGTVVYLSFGSIVD